LGVILVLTEPFLGVVLVLAELFATKETAETTGATFAHVDNEVVRG
jgi:hypothetical protein